MSLVAKLFVVFNLVLSVAFLVFAANVWTAQTKWQKMYEEERMKSVELLAATQKRQVALSREVVRTQQASDAKDEKLDAMKKQYNEVRDRELMLQTDIATLKNARDLKDAENQELQREVRRLGEELQKLKGVIIKQQSAVVVERDNAVKARNEKSELENELNTLKQVHDALARDYEGIQRDLEQQNNRMAKLMTLGVPVDKLLGTSAAATQPALPDSVVLAAKPEQGLVVISIGAQQGVKPGYQFTISRGDQYIGKVQIDRVFPELSSARIIKDLTPGEVKVNDEARSR